MRPRLISRGNFAAPEIGRWPGKASMRPRLISRGNGTLLDRATQRNVGFNEAATDQSRKSEIWWNLLQPSHCFNEAATDQSRKYKYGSVALLYYRQLQ